MVTDPIKSKEGRTLQIGGLQLGARAGRPPIGSVRSGGAEARPIRAHHRTASTTTVQTRSRNIRTQRRAVGGSADHADKATAPSYTAYCSSHHSTEGGMASRRSTPGQPGRGPQQIGDGLLGPLICIYLYTLGSAYKNPRYSSR